MIERRVRKMTEAKTPSGISTTTLIAGIIIAILASSALSIMVAKQFATGPQGPAGILNPDYDSGWVATNDSIVVQFNHTLGTNDIFVYVLAKWYRNWPGSGGPMVHQFYYGGDSHGTPEQTQGFYWNCYTENPNMIQVSQYGGRADELRVLIWKLPAP
jgi:hypothetical protein